MNSIVRCPSCGHDWIVVEKQMQVDAGIRVVNSTEWPAHTSRVVHRCASCKTVVDTDTDEYGDVRTPHWEGDVI